MQGKHILLGISGGIAAYKIPSLIRLLRKEGADVRCVTTPNALQFVTETTLRTLSGAPVYTDVFAAVNRHATEHISLPEWADLLIVAPATANVLGKFAAGIADDALTTTFASTAARKPVVIAPAMNERMYANPATQAAMTTLASRNGITLLDCAEGDLACGITGKGRMQEVDILLEAALYALTPKTLQNRHILITAGPTREKLDPVRFLSNYSTGKMGYAIARECLLHGAEVTLVSGPVTETLSPFHNDRLHRLPVCSAAEMAETTCREWHRADTAILAAAVADFTPEEVAPVKRKKQPGQDTVCLPLKQTQDIARTLGENKQPGQKLIGFALETDHEEENAHKKLQAKNLDWIILNSLRDSGAGFGYDTNKVTLIPRRGDAVSLPLMQKKEVAQAIVSRIL